MFILCPQCQFLVAIEPASGLPPPRCPRCGHALHPEPQAPSSEGIASPPATETETERDIEAAELADSSAAATLDADALGEAIAQGAPMGVGGELASEPPAAVLASPQPPVAPRDEASPATAAPEPAATSRDDVSLRDIEPGSPARASASARVRRPATPSFVHVPPADAGGPTGRGPMIAVLAGLALLLVLQLLLADRARLAADARWRPALASLCGVLHCALPSWHEPEAFTLVARDVRPARPGVLHVSASFRNDARWAQAWPALHLALQDVDGRTVGARVFAPREYLGREVTQNEVAPGQVASVAFDVGEPPGTVVAFTFDFR